jgi:superfamily I DNA/RNA helicase
MSDLFTRAAASLARARRPIEAAEAPRLRNLAGRFSKALPVIKNLDAEQQLAVLTDGWVCVGAGAGSGKTTTLEARVKLLLQEGARPERILVVTFNRKAANEIRERLASSVSEVTLSMLRLGTMHSQFARWVQQYGTAAEKAAITTRLIRNDRSGRDAPTSRQLAGIMSRQWYECREDKPPRDASNLIQRWSVEGLTPAEAMKGALTKAELSAAVWYEWWLGFRGFLGRAWSPPCVTKRGQARWKEFLRRYRPTGGELLGEINDMVLLFGQIVKRDAAAVARIRQELDHILVDEGQDLNKVQHDIIGTLGADLGSAPRSLWIVGDERQSINAFVGASPKLFAELPRKGFKLRTIRTNYRCLPEIVEAANRLMEHQPSQLNIASRPDPGKLRGNARISVVSGLTHEESAQRVMASIRLALASGAEPARFAILARTNLELSAFESAAIVARVPYTRRGSASFLTSPEVAIVKGYLDFFAGDGEEERTQALAKIIDKPSRFFLRQGEGAIVVKKSLASIGRSARPGSLFDLLSSERGLAAIRAELRALPSWQEWQSDQVSEELGRMARQLLGIRAGVQQGKYSTRKLLDEILRIEGAPVNSGDERPTLGQTLLPFGGDDEDDTSTVQSSDMPIGNVQFFYLLLDDQPELQQPGAFVKHLGELAKNSNQLRYDADSASAALRCNRGAGCSEPGVFVGPRCLPRKAHDSA